MSLKNLFVAALAAAPALAWADADTRADAGTTPWVLPDVVTASRSGQPDVRQPAALSVITARQIAESGATQIVDVLRSLGTVQVADQYGDGSRAQIDLRGFGDSANANTLILVDGRRLNNPDIASPDLNSIPLRNVERIEVLHGSAGALYGDQAVGGVINIITREQTGDHASLTLDGGSYGRIGARAEAGLSRDRYSLRLSGESRHSDNYRDHNTLDYSNLTARAGYRWTGGEGYFETSFINEDLLTPGSLFASEVRADRRQSVARYRNDYSDTDTRVLRLGLKQSLGSAWTLDAEISDRRSDGSFRLGTFGVATQDSSQDREIWAFTPRASASFATARGLWLVTVGSDLQRADYTLSSQFGTQTNRQDQVDVYAQTTVPLRSDLDLTVGLRRARADNKVRDGYTFVDTTSFGDDQTAGQAGLSWHVLSALRLFANVDRSFRYAKVDEFTNAGAQPASNRNLLRSQAGNSYEAGAEWRTRKLNLRTTLYRMDLDDEIVFDPTTFTNINLDRTRRDGIAIDGRWQVIESLSLAAGARYIDAQIVDGPFRDNPVPMVASRTGRLSADLSLPRALNLYAEVLATGSRAFAGDYDHTLGSLPSYASTNLALGWHWRALDLKLRVNNLFDQRYSEYGVAGTDPNTFAEAPAYQPSPERNVAVSLKLAL